MEVSFLGHNITVGYISQSNGLKCFREMVMDYPKCWLYISLSIQMDIFIGFHQNFGEHFSHHKPICPRHHKVFATNITVLSPFEREHQFKTRLSNLSIKAIQVKFSPTAVQVFKLSYYSRSWRYFIYNLICSY